MVEKASRQPRAKDIWGISQSVVLMLSSIAVPLVIAGIGASYNTSMKDSENRVRYVELAIAQLRSPPTPETAALREWAVEVLDSQSPIKLSSAAKTQLKSGPLPLVLSATAHGGVGSGTSSGAGGNATATISGPAAQPADGSHQ